MTSFSNCGFGATKQMVKQILLGQALAFLNSLTGVSTTKLGENNASYPVLQCVTSYVFILAVYGPAFLFIYFKLRNRKYSDFKFFDMWWKYAILAFIDLEANYVAVRAYQYTNMMSIQLIGCFTVPCVLVLSFFLLKAKFALTHIAGGVIAIGGLVLLIALDADGLSRSTSGGSQEVLGDMLCLISSALYATSNVLTELFVKPAKQARLFTCCRKPDEDAGVNDTTPALRQHESEEPAEHHPEDGDLDAEAEYPKVPVYVPVVENLAIMSAFAAVFATIQFFAAEWKDFKPMRSQWTGQDWLFQMVFGVTMLLLYTAMPTMFIIASAAFANISLLTANIYGIIWNVTIFKIYPTKLFFVSYLIIVVGILLYNLTDIIRIPFCHRWNYPCGDPFKGQDGEIETDNDEHAHGGARSPAQCELSSLPNAPDSTEKPVDVVKPDLDGLGQVEELPRER